MARKGQKTSEFTRIKQSMAAIGRKKSLEHRQAMSVGRRGMKLSDSHKLNIRKSLSRAYSEGRRVSWNIREDREQFEAEKKAARFCRNALHRALALIGSPKQDKTFKLLGYTPKQLVDNISKKFKDGMSWKNHGYGNGKWHVDHIKPLSRWSKDSTPAQINALENLQPLWHQENLSKQARWSQ